MAKLPTITEVRIFISSPGDVREERDLLEDVITNELQPTIGKQLGLYLHPMRWEKMVTPHMGDIQKNVFKEMGEYDIFVGLFWKRFGTPTSEHESGSEAEFRDAYRKWEEDRSRPILMYFREKAFSPNLEDLEQYAKVLTYKKELEGKGLYWSYTETDQFRKDVSRHLYKKIQELVPKTPAQPAFRSARPETQQPDPVSRQRYLLNLRRECMRIPLTTLGDDIDGSRPVALDQVFISLEVIEKDHERLRAAAEDAMNEEEGRMTALEALNTCKYAVLLGDPGAGKSSLVKHVLANLAGHELDNDEALLEGTAGLLPVLIVLRDLAPQLNKATLPERGKRRENALAEQVLKQALLAAEECKAPDFAAGIEQAFIDEQVFLVLDGLDEVPYALRPLVREATAAVLGVYNLRRVVVTCRIRSYTGEAVFKGVPTYTLAPLDEERISSFIKSWYQAQCNLGRVLEKDRPGRVEDLLQAATTEPLVSLAANPMLLTTMTIIHQKKARLPDERVRLYKDAVELLLKRWQEDNAGLPDDLADFIGNDKRVRPAMEKLAFKAHEAGKEDNTADILRDDAIEVLMEPQHVGDEIKAIQFLNYVDLRSGLLVGRGGSPNRPHVYSFPHRTFQEYLAGCFIIGARGATARIQQLAAEGDFWSEAVLLGIEEQVYNSGSYGLNQILNLSSWLSKHPPKTEGESRQTLWAARMADVVGAEIVEEDPGDGESGAALLERLRSHSVQLLSGPLPPLERAEAGRVLGKLGDPREAVTTLHRMMFSFIPKGPFLMGDDAVEVDVPYEYWMGVYPVTQAQFQRFAETGGYVEKTWWTDAGWAYIKKREPGGLYQMGYPYQLPNHPVVAVSWYEANAYTKWLTEYGAKKGWFNKEIRITLPNDPEWEKAARGGLHVPVEEVICSLEQLTKPVEGPVEENKEPGRVYPWGNQFEKKACNYGGSGIGAPSSPGCFNHIHTPYGLTDMSGNVMEWLRSRYDDCDYASLPFERWQEFEEERGAVRRVVRGGSFFLTY